jgi:hypothetical protein
LIPIQHIGAYCRGDGLSEMGDPDRPTVLSLDDDPDLSGAEDLSQGVGSDPWPGRQSHPGLTMGGCGEGSVDKDFGRHDCPILVFTIVLFSAGPGE